MIYIDLDDCLVCQHYARSSSRSVLRPGALKLLEELRKLGDTFLISAGTRAHVYGRNDQHELGFTKEQIIAREDLYTETWGNVADYYPTLIPVKTNVCPLAVLIDNNPPAFPYTGLKLKWLGIPKERFIQVSSFYMGCKDTFEAQIPELLNQITKLLHEPKSSFATT